MNKSVHMIGLNVKYNQMHVEKILIHYVTIMQSYEKYRQHNNIYIRGWGGGCSQIQLNQLAQYAANSHPLILHENIKKNYTIVFAEFI